MKRFVLILIVVGSSLVHSRADAAFVLGNQAFISNATSSAGNNVNSTSFTLSFATLAGGSNQTGDFVGTAGAFVDVLSTATPGTFVFGDGTYGTFTVTSVNVNNLIPKISRTLNFTGLFHPGAATFGPTAQTTHGTLTVTINQATKGVLSASATLATSVPEPASVVMLGTFCVPAAFGFIRRRRRQNA